MPELSPIPIPPAQRWKDFKVQAVPLVAFLAVLLTVSYLWTNFMSAPTLNGQVEIVEASVVSPEAGVLTNLYVTRFQRVQAGDMIGELASTDVQKMGSQLDLLRSRLAVAQARASYIIDRQRLAFESTTLLANYLKESSDIAAAKAELGPSAKDMDIASKLFNEQIFTQQEYDFFAKDYARLDATVKTSQNYLDELQDKLRDTRYLSSAFSDSDVKVELDQYRSELEAAQKDLKNLRLPPVKLYAPISGMIAGILKRPGENVSQGQPILMIQGEQPERIIGYLRQPFTLEPKVGMHVQVRSRTLRRNESDAQIVQVGAAFEPITQALIRPGLTHEFGLPLAISIPANLHLHPGEVVDLTIQPLAK